VQEQSRLAVRRFLGRARQRFHSQDELAEFVTRLGHPVKRSAVGHWMTGLVERVPAWVVFALAAELQLPLNEFVAGQSWEERLTAIELQATVHRAEIDHLNQRLATLEKQATGQPMTSDRPEV
jgi:hypothetical protein